MVNNGKIRGAMLGHLVGDAFGVPYEFHSPQSLPHEITMIPPVDFRRGHHGVEPGTYSDDGAQTLILLESLLNNSGLNVTDLYQHLQYWAFEGYMAVDEWVFDIGGQTISALRGGQDSVKGGKRSKGNGSLMRVAPIAVYGVVKGVDVDTLIEWAMASSKVTHPDPECQVACAIYTVMLYQVLNGVSDVVGTWYDACATIASHFEDNAQKENDEALKVVENYVDGDEVNGHGYVLNALKIAVDVMYDATSYQDAVTRAVKYGYDTDTNACVIGALAGAKWGYMGIPVQWLRTLRAKRLYNPLIQRLIRNDD